MKMGDDAGLLLEVARHYYEKGLSKSDIAQKKGTSVTQITRLLKEAHDRGIVQIRYNPPRLESLGMELMREFECLRKAIVVPSSEEYKFQRRVWGEAAADYFDQNVKSKMKVGISGGSTLYEMVSALPYRKREITIYPTALIGRGPTIEHIDPLVLVTLLWAKSGRGTTAYDVAVFPYEIEDTKESPWYRGYLKRKKVMQVYDAIKEVDIIFCSVGPVEVPKEHGMRHTAIEILQEFGIDEEELKQEGVVGDINYCFFDENGSTRAGWDYFLTLSVNNLRKMAADSKKQVVVIAGHYKSKALRAVLKGRLCNVLITDDATARSLLRNDRDGVADREKDG